MALSSFFNKKKKTQETADNVTNQVREIAVAAIIPNRYQPRKVFKADSINELAETIAAHGLLQPIVVREYAAGQYEIIAGERRFRAVKKLAWSQVPAIIDNLDDNETAAMALIENLQREALSPIEEAQAYQSLLSQDTMTQTQLAQAVGKSQSFIANKLRLLKLPDTIQEAIINGEISERHGRALLRVNEIDQQIILHKILSEHLTVKDTEQAIYTLQNPEPKSDTAPMAVEKPEATGAKSKKSKTVQPPKSAKRKISGRSKDPKLAINTLRQSLAMIQEAGVDLKIEENDAKDVYSLTVKIDK
ncbi:nucleoid occlusion protein [Agrilactobacillus yilanensis]|uniref:Nucleoid occlusion protein n=1 Tax=Agrilactobacillus yilanensis TaxID=2485997 RepID=A0ABW4JB56_9LACO|nr:nucleoid occlusion protein [Agrilactobacillus yilanensis]